MIFTSANVFRDEMFEKCCSALVFVCGSALPLFLELSDAFPWPLEPASTCVLEIHQMAVCPWSAVAKGGVDWHFIFAPDVTVGRTTVTTTCKMPGKQANHETPDPLYKALTLMEYRLQRGVGRAAWGARKVRQGCGWISPKGPVRFPR